MAITQGILNMEANRKLNASGFVTDALRASPKFSLTLVLVSNENDSPAPTKSVFMMPREASLLNTPPRYEINSCQRMPKSDVTGSIKFPIL